MEVPEHRRWMDKRLEDGGVTEEFVVGVLEFAEFASKDPDFLIQRNPKMRCPCKKCQCVRHQYGDDVMAHLCTSGFMPNYYYWTSHGEPFPPRPPIVVDDAYYGVGEHREQFNLFEHMVMDHASPEIGQAIQHDSASIDQHIEEDPNPNAQRFYEMLEAAQAPLFDGCLNYSELSASLVALSIKSDFNMAEGCFNRWVEFLRDILPDGNRMAHNLYQAKKSVANLGLGFEKIECCENGCMLYRGEYALETFVSCRFCGADRHKSRTTRKGKVKKTALQKIWYFPITPRLQIMYSSMATAPHMRWHDNNQRDPNVLCHPSDGEAWKHFDRMYPEFSQEARNVKLGLCTDGFNPFGQYGKQYSCWPVILTPYNLPPGMCMKREVMFLTIIIPGPFDPGRKIDVYLQPLIEELTTLWNYGAVTYDVSMRQNFTMKACLMWTINDFPAYGTLSGWMTTGKLGCPCCMGRTKGFSLKNSRKICYFDVHRIFLEPNHPYRWNKTAFKNGRVETASHPPRLSGEEIWHQIKSFLFIHEYGGSKLDPNYDIDGYGDVHNWTKKSIFWSLPYWKTHLLRHNIDVMHTERNVFMNVFDTVMDVNGKTKDNPRARLDIAEVCKRRELELKDIGNGKLKKPKAKYVLSKPQRVAVCEWVKQLKLPDGYASNLSRCVNIKEGKLHGMKSHDCHVFMQRLLPIAFASLPNDIWKPLAELSQFFRLLTSTTLNVEQLRVIEHDVPILLCKLEQIFPPSFFDAMEHLPIHLPYEARLGGPVQYRWMYPFERFLRSLKAKVKNKARIEGSICEVYLLEEASTFASFYYPSDIDTRRTRIPRNVDAGEGPSTSPQISIFNYPGRACGASGTSYFSDRDVKVAQLYVLLNCAEVDPYLNQYTIMLRELHADKSDSQIQQDIAGHFVMWFKTHVQDMANQIQDPLLIDLAWGPLRIIQTHETYIINGYKFQTRARGEYMKSCNYGVCVRGTNGQLEDDFFGILTDIIEIQYYGRPTKKLVLFKCKWFDNTPNRGTKVDNRFGTVEVRQSRSYQVYDPFIFAQQAEQVYYTPYPEGHRDWLGVIKIKARSAITDNAVNKPETEDPYQEVHEINGLQVMLHIDPDDYSNILADAGGVDEEDDTALLDQDDLNEEDENRSIPSDREESESDFSDTDSD